MADTRQTVQRWRRGQIAAARRQRELLACEGPRPDQAVAEALAALRALETMGLWPGPRDPVAERAVETVRARWTRIETRARAAAQSRTR